MAERQLDQNSLCDGFTTTVRAHALATSSPHSQSQRRILEKLFQACVELMARLTWTHGSAEQATLAFCESLGELRPSTRKRESRNAQPYKLLGGCSSGCNAHFSPWSPEFELTSAQKDKNMSLQPASSCLQGITGWRTGSKPLTLEF